MGIYTGTDLNELIRPGSISASVTADPPGSTPSGVIDTLIGGGGDDWLDGGSGADILIGGTGNDTYVVQSRGDAITEDPSAAGGVDTVRSVISYTLGAGLENLVLKGGAPIGGTGNELDNTLTGSRGSNFLDGGAGDDILDGRSNVDTMAGGTGNDTYVVDNRGDTVIEDASDAGGTDTVQSFVRYRLGSGLENLSLEGSASVNGRGNDLANTLVGNDGRNVLKGGDGRDTLDGAKGVDRLVGGDGNDEFLFARPGQAGDDIRDFRDNRGNNDRILVDATSFRGGLDEGRLSRNQFQTSSDNEAQDADIRFIFDTSDHTLWFDRNGDRQGGLTLIADLQASATVEHNDIFLV